MNYERQILQILTGVGERGITALLLAKHVYNLNTSLFSQPDFQEIYRYVQQYLRRNSKCAQPLVVSTVRRGYYRLNTRNKAVRQLMLDFRNQESGTKEEEAESPSPDLSLSLFD